MKKGRGQLSRRNFIELTALGAAALAVRGPLACSSSLERSAMSHRERIERALAFEATDRLPFGILVAFPQS